ncbi:MAG: class I SAM-dependent methyltransferase [Candidatus Magasanikiibacteriota bacterium]
MNQTQSTKFIAHISHGWRNILESPKIYNLWQKICGAEKWKKRIINEYIKPIERKRILDVGCGTGSILTALNKKQMIDYVGCDININYINFAKKNNPKYGHFYCCGVDNLPTSESNFDIVLAIAIFHHLDDTTSLELIKTIKQKLNKNGVFILAEPVWTEKQSLIEKFLMKKDRGQNIKTEAGYLELLKSNFSIIESKIISDSHYIPWTVNLIVSK